MEWPKHYDAKKVEEKWRKYWEKNKIYKFDPKSKKPVFSIDVPPPYASAGHLHVGHALHYTQFEIIARQRRMAGYNVYFAPCFDDNGLPTEKYVEEKLDISKKDTTKAEFRKLCIKESAKVEKAYADKVFRKLGYSYDWNLLYTTISPEAQKVSQTSFVKLVKQGDAYRSEEPTLWCPFHQTALAQAEVEDLKRMTKLNFLYFGLEGSEDKIEIATTRPELLPACVGVFVHPDDKRYKKMVGKNAIVPLFDYKVPIMTDEKVDPEFGSGIVMVCTFGDTTDVEWWKKHKLDLRICITDDGKLNKLSDKYEGLSLEEGRKKIIKDLDSKGYLIKQEDLEQSVGVCWRCSTPVEFIVTKQWFIKTLEHKKKLIEYGKKVSWFPDFFRKRYEDWVNNLAWDWCISRQRYFGVPIPVWYCKKCGEYLLPDEKDLPLDPEQKKLEKKCKCGFKDLEADHDVFDTWMTSSMTPEIAIRWLEKPKEFKKMFPVTWRVQSSDIIRTWAFYTILKAYLHFKNIPWRDIAIGTFVLDPKGRGMSKSKGNVVWTEELLENYDVDTFRYWVGNARWGGDLPFKEQELIAGKRFLTKLWNASRFTISHLQDYDVFSGDLEIMDKWFFVKLNKLIKKVNGYYESYNTGEAKRDVEHFFWSVFCDNYLEVIKDRLYNPGKRGDNSRKSAQHSLYTGLLSLLKMFAPVMPFITEEIYSLYYDKQEKHKSIHLSNWPIFDEGMVDEDIEKIGDKFIETLGFVRQEKSKNKKSLKELVKVLYCDEILKDAEEDLKAVTKAEKVVYGKELKVEF